MRAGPSLDYYIVPVTSYQQNCTIVVCPKTNKCAVIDPGGDVDQIMEEVERQGLDVEKIWITHPHFDHANGVKELKTATGAIIEGSHIADRFWVENPYNSFYGVSKENRFVPDRWLQDGDKVTVGETTWEALHCPGHTLGHIVYYNRENKFAQVGDVIFKNSMGRYTLWGGCRAELVNSIWKKLFPLGDVNFVAGHREESNLKKERETNWAVGDRAQRGLMMPFALYLDVFDIAFRGPGRLIEAWRWSRMNRCNM